MTAERELELSMSIFESETRKENEGSWTIAPSICGLMTREGCHQSLLEVGPLTCRSDPLRMGGNLRCYEEF